MKSMFGYKPYLLFGLLQAISALWSVTSPNNHKQGSHTHTASLSLHKAKRTRGTWLWKNCCCCCCWQFIIKI